MINFKKPFIATALCSAILMLTGCNGDQGNNEKFQIRISSNQVNSHPEIVAMSTFKEHIEKNLGDKFEVTLFPNSSLGANEKVLELVRQGGVQMIIISSPNIETFDPIYSLFSIPYLFNSEQEFENYISNPELLNKLNKNREKDKFEALTAFTSGTRNFYTKTPVRSVDDLYGKKIRVQAGPINVKMINALGAAATPMAYGEVYAALQQGVIDGAENTELALTDMKHGEVCKYYTYDNHQMNPDFLLASTKFMDTLTDNERKIFQEAANKARDVEFNLWDKRINEVRELAKNEMNVEFINVDINEFRNKLLPLHHEILNDIPAIRPLYDEIMALNNGTK